MSSFESGVTAYVKAQATVTVYFPIDSKGNEFVCCEQCEFYRVSSRSCALNGKVCQFPGKYVGQYCPLERID